MVIRPLSTVAPSPPPPSLVMPLLLQWKSVLKREIASFDGKNLLLFFYYLIPSEIWPNKRGSLIKGSTVHVLYSF